MTDPYFQNLFADRIGGANYGKGTEIYKFEKIKRAKRAALKDFPGRKLLDFGIGENDSMAAADVRSVMKAEVDRPENRGYADNGIQEFKDAAARFMEREFGVRLDPITEVNHCIGSKTALAMLPLAFINPGDVTLMTVPGYPVAGTHTKYCGGQVYNLLLRQENSFYPELGSIPRDVLDRAKILVINYPNSPSGQLATRAFYESVIEFALKNKLVVIQDAAHIMLSYREKPLSFLEIDGAKEVGVEVHSLSKGFDMSGWRLGFVAGNERLVRAFADIKDNCDSGQFMAIQKAGVKALDDAGIPAVIRSKYERRLRKLVSTLNDLGFKADMPGGTYFLYVPSAKGIENGPQFKNAEEFSQFLIRERSVCTVPWDDAGSFLRFSVTYQAENESEEDALMAALRERLAGDKLVW
ncbi:MAG: LL-diaminopimelate aminotransferase [Deltaproteobacteria bacterium]|nr:LL-diaminopimelate aminotransferase [Deltaproteobacteria bacterium]